MGRVGFWVRRGGWEDEGGIEGSGAGQDRERVELMGVLGLEREEGSGKGRRNNRADWTLGG